MKKYILIAGGFFMLNASWAQSSRVDTAALVVLDHMADVVGELHSCSFRLLTSVDTESQYGAVKYTQTDDVSFSGPDKMLINSTGDKGHKGFWYNGEYLTYYSYNENNFAKIKAPATTIQTIDSVSNTFGVDFPAADFFYPTFTDDLIAHFETIVLLGTKTVNGVECYHILGSNKSMLVQFWISSDAYNLPMKFVITYKEKNNMQYEATFSNWLLNPSLPASIFEFTPPAGSAKIKLLAKNKK